MKRFAFAGIIALGLVFAATRWYRSEPSGFVRLTGVVSANEAVVASELSGRIRELRVSEGDWVRKGQVIAVLDTDEIDARRQSRLATIDQLSSRVEQGREKVRLERARVTSQIEGAKASLRAAESQREEVRAELVQAKKELERAVELVEQGLVAEQSRDRHQTLVEVVEARLQTEEDRVEAARAQLELHRASERQIRVVEQDVEQTEAQLVQARADLDEVTVRLGYTELESPLDGMVSIRVAREGEFVTAGEPVVTVVDLTDVWVRAEVEETLVSRLVIGQPLEVRLASDDVLTGRVTFISPEAEFATQRDVDRVKRDIRTFGIKIAVPNPDRRVHPGMTAYVILPLEKRAVPPMEPLEPLPPLQEDSPPIPTTGDAELGEEPEEPEREASSPEPVGIPEPSTAPPEPSSTATRPLPTAAAPVNPETETTSLVPAPPPQPSPRAAEGLETLLAGIDLDEPSDEELAELEAALLTGAAAEEQLAEPEVEPENGPAAATEPARSPVDLPPWARPRPTPASPDGAGCQPVVDDDAPAALRLEGISTIDGKPVAIINGIRVFVGGIVDGARVVGIGDGMVRLDRDGRQITLTF